MFTVELRTGGRGAEPEDIRPSIIIFETSAEREAFVHGVRMAADILQDYVGNWIDVRSVGSDTE